MMKGKCIYLSQKEMSLIIEAIDMLRLDYLENGHPDEEFLEKLENKIFKNKNSPE